MALRFRTFAGEPFFRLGLRPPILVSRGGLGEGQKSWSSTRNSAKRSSRNDTPTSTVYELEGRIIFAAIFATKLRGATRCDSINNRFFAPEIT